MMPLGLRDSSESTYFGTYNDNSESCQLPILVENDGEPILED